MARSIITNVTLITRPISTFLELNLGQLGVKGSLLDSLYLHSKDCHAGLGKLKLRTRVNPLFGLQLKINGGC